MSLFWSTFVLSAGIAFGASNHLPADSLKKVREVLQNETACFVLKEKSANKPEITFGKATCEETYPLGNRELMPLAALATDLGLIQDEKTLFKWDGTRYPNRLWNKDQFVTDWIQNQVAWVTDRLRLQIGSQAIEKYLAGVQLGGESSTEKFLIFSERFFTGALPTSRAHQEVSKRFFFLGKYRFGSELWGQKASDLNHASFTGCLVSKNRVWTFSTHLSPSKNSKEPLTAERAQALSMDILTELGLF